MQQARWRDECAVRHAQRALQATVLGRWGWRLRRRRACLSCQLSVVAVWAQRLRRRHTMRGGLERLRAAARRQEAGVRAARRRLGAAALARLLRGWAVTAEMSRERREAEEERRGLAAAERVQLGVRARCWGGWLAFVEARRFEHEARSRTDELWSKARRRLQHVAPCRPTTIPCIIQACSTRPPPCALRLPPYVSRSTAGSRSSTATLPRCHPRLRLRLRLLLHLRLRRLEPRRRAVPKAAAVPGAAAARRSMRRSLPLTSAAASK